MRGNARSRRCRPVAIAGPVAVVFGMLSAPAHALDPERMCSAITLNALSGISTSSVEAAARGAEAMMSRGTASPKSMLQTDDPSAAGTEEVPSLASLAEYCAAAGEANRVGVDGSQFQAQRYLLAAFRYAEEADAPQLAARAAYRLGLASLSGTAVADAGGSRGARAALRGGRRGTVAQAAPEGPTPMPVAAGACDALSGAELAGGYAITVNALECAAERGRATDAVLASRASLRLARFNISAGDVAGNRGALRSAAVRAAGQGLQSAESVSDPRLRAELIGRLVEAALDAGADPKVLGAPIEAMRTAAPSDPAILAMAAALDGRRALALRDSEGANALLQQAVFLESQRAQPLRLSDWLLLLAEADPAQRTRYVTEAYRALEAIRPVLPLTDPVTEESNFALRMRKVFQAAVDVQLAGLGEDGDDPVRIARAQQIVEAYREAEIQTAFGSECVPPREPIRPEQLAANEIVLYPILLGDRIELIFASGAEGQKRYRRLPPVTGVGAGEVARLADAMVSDLVYYVDGDWKAPAARLYELLIRPVEDLLGPDTTLVIVPDGPLRQVPFAALQSSDGRFLIERTRLSLAPSLSYSQPGRPESVSQPSVLAAALEKEVTLPAGTFAALTATAAEARAATGAGLDGTRPGRLLENFTKQQLVGALEAGDIDILHLATHAAFNGRSDRSFIVADGEAILLSELRDIIARGRVRGDELALLVLSACETAVGDDQASMGLAGVAVQAGAQSVVASLWQVNDVGTAGLMEEFYRSIRTGAAKGEALRTAQLAMIRKGGEGADPYIWAAFALLGGWR